VFDGKLLYSKIQKHNMELKYSLNGFRNCQIKSIYKYMNLKRKLFMCNAHIKFNQTCQKENLVPKYAQINRRIYNNNNAAIKTKTDAQKMRIRNEIKPQYKKKNLINSELLKTFLHNANVWGRIWDHIEQNIHKKLQLEMTKNTTLKKQN
jgi:hypothetical protein